MTKAAPQHFIVPVARRLRRPLTLIALASLLPVVLAACAPPLKSSAPTSGPATPVSAASSAPASSSPAAAAASSVADPIPVHVSLLESDTATYGIGMPIIAYFTAPITDPTAFEKATTVTVNGAPANGAWYFEQSPAGTGHAIEGHYRPQNYWPGNASIRMNMPIKGLSGGGRYVFNDSLTLSIATGDAHTATVNAATERMMVYSNGTLVRTMPVSLGAAATPTFNGVKVVEQKNNPVRMIGTGSDHYDLLVPWSVRMTNSGEYIHAASWNGGNIGIRSTSNGCTNLNTADAEWYYNFALIGDPVDYINTTGGPMPVWDGYGDWNVAWSTWQAGGLLQSDS